MPDSSDKAISKVLEAARRKLLDTGTRNRLVHVNRANARLNCLNIVNERAGDVYAVLRTQSKRMRFKALGKDTGEAEEGLPLATSDADFSAMSASRQPDAILDFTPQRMRSFR